MVVVIFWDCIYPPLVEIREKKAPLYFLAWLGAFIVWR